MVRKERAWGLEQKKEKEKKNLTMQRGAGWGWNASSACPLHWQMGRNYSSQNFVNNIVLTELDHTGLLHADLLCKRSYTVCRAWRKTIGLETCQKTSQTARTWITCTWVLIYSRAHLTFLKSLSRSNNLKRLAILDKEFSGSCLKRQKYHGY